MAEFVPISKEDYECVMVLCNCSDIEQWSTTALKMILGKGTAYNGKLPDYYKLKGKDQIMKRASRFPKGSEMRDILEGLAKTEDKFSYYFEFTDYHDYKTKISPSVGYDLIKGRRVY